MVSRQVSVLFLTLNWLCFSYAVSLVDGKKGHPFDRNLQSDFYIPDNWGHFLLYEGCFPLSGTPAKERTDPQNNNNECSDFCHKEKQKFSASIGERCLCFGKRPTGRLLNDPCKTECPNPVQNDGKPCKEIDCCGSTDDNTVTVIQTINLVPHRHEANNKNDHVTHSRDFGSFVEYRGCFSKSGINPVESRNDEYNANSACTGYCATKGITYAATISDRCLCLESLPSNELANDQCDTPCPGNILSEGEACAGISCCGSQANSALSIYQSSSASRDKLSKKENKSE